MLVRLLYVSLIRPHLEYAVQSGIHDEDDEEEEESELSAQSDESDDEEDIEEDEEYNTYKHGKSSDRDTLATACFNKVAIVLTKTRTIARLSKNSS